MSEPGLLNTSEAAQILREGGVIAYPTEAVYGLGCDPSNETAVRRILELKQRPAAMGLILIAADIEQITPFIQPLGDELRQRALNAWPGPVTWLIPRNESVPDWLAGSHPTIALRVSAHPLCRELCRAFGGAIVSTSANPSEQPPARTAQQVAAYFGDRLEGIVAGDLGDEKQPSTIRDLASGRVLRQG